MKVAAILLCTLATAFAASVPFNSWRIVGGEDAADGQFPYQISLRRYNSHSCGGSILDETTILCAAHCVDGASPSSLTVSAGTNKLNEDGQIVKVESIRAHKDYNSYLITNDVSIIKLSSPLELNEKVQPVKLRQSNIGDDDEVTLSGWGRTSYPGSIPNELQRISLKTISVADCQKRHAWSTVIDSEVCTLTKRGEGACHGDSGGPLVDSNSEQIGIVSWGRPCGQGYPDVFTRVHSFLDWIEENRQ